MNNIKISHETIGILKDDYNLNTEQIKYIRGYVESYEEISDEYFEPSILICGDAFAEAINFNKIHKEDIKYKLVEFMSPTESMDKNLRNYYNDLNICPPQKKKIK